MLGTTQSSTTLRTLVAALALTAGALLYFSDHDNIDRHWRIALVMVLSATLLVIWPPIRPDRRRTGLLTVLVLTLALGGCSMRASHALMGAGLVTATSAALAPDDGDGSLRPATISVGLAVFAVGWVLHQSDNPHGGTAPSQQIYTLIESQDAHGASEVAGGETLGIYRRLPSDHVLFTP
ncbi:MAG: hypothetical protein H0T42_07380 [Deltaproteobacteria bacterium]|nr:hypothetical protein [Deltaproteobacteria bacterium]